MAACRLHALSFNYTLEVIDECSKSSPGPLSRAGPRPPVANHGSNAKNFPPQICVDAEIILPKMAHVLRPSLTPSAPLPRPDSCSTGAAVHHSFAEHPSRKAKPPAPNRSIGRKPLSQMLAPLWYRSQAKAVALGTSLPGRFIAWRILSGCFFKFGITKLKR